MGDYKCLTYVSAIILPIKFEHIGSASVADVIQVLILEVKIQREHEAAVPNSPLIVGLLIPRWSGQLRNVEAALLKQR